MFTVLSIGSTAVVILVWLFCFGPLFSWYERRKILAKIEKGGLRVWISYHTLHPEQDSFLDHLSSLLRSRGITINTTIQRIDDPSKITHWQAMSTLGNKTLNHYDFALDILLYPAERYIQAGNVTYIPCDNKPQAYITEVLMIHMSERTSQRIITPVTLIPDEAADPRYMWAQAQVAAYRTADAIVKAIVDHPEMISWIAAKSADAIPERSGVQST